VRRPSDEPRAREPSDGFHVVAAYPHQRVEVALLRRLVGHAPEVKPERGEVARIFFVGLVVNVVRLAVDPTDGPVIPGEAAPAPAARALVRVLLQPRRLVREAGGVSDDEERRAVAEGEDAGEAPRVVQRLPGRAGPARRAGVGLVGFGLPRPEDVVARAGEGVESDEGAALAGGSFSREHVEPELADGGQRYRLYRLARVAVIVAGHQRLVALAAKD